MPRTITPRTEQLPSGKWRVKLSNKRVDGGPWDTEAEAMRAGWLALEDMGRGGQDDQLTVAEFADRWTRVDQRTKAGKVVPGPYVGRRGPATMRHNAERISTFVVQYGHLRMGDITKRIARDFWTENTTRGMVLRSMFNDALKDDVVGVNPFARLGLDPKVARTRGRKRIQALTPTEVDELASFARVLDAERYRSMFHADIIFAAYTGLRHGEQTALRWSDVNFKAGTITVVRQWLTKDAIYAPVKGRDGMTEADGRTIVLFPQAATALAEIEATYGREFCTQNWKGETEQLIFTTPMGKRLNHRNHYYFWKPVRAAFLATLSAERIEQLRGNNPDQTALHWHDLRHYTGSWLVDRGVSSRDTAEQLGHIDGGRLVDELYGHTYNENSLARMRAMIGDEPAPKRRQRRAQ
jgi:integrase